MILNEDNYYSLEADLEYCSASQFLDLVGRPLIPGCEARVMAKLRGEYEQEITKAMLIGSILDALWEGADSEELVKRFPDCVSSRGATKGQIKSEYQQAIQLYQRTLKDETFVRYMSGEHQPIFTCEIEGLKFKSKLDSYHPGKAIVDLKTTKNVDVDFRYFIPDSGERLPFFYAWNYDVQLSLYREAVRQTTGELCTCYICAVDKNPHPKVCIIEFEDEVLDKALDYIKRNCERIIRLKSGEIEPIRCEHDGCDYCRDTYVATVMTTSEFEAHDIEKGAV
ncbi:MAG: PD-(D/E)XK nuclease-like domain-containing protein [Lachnospiraceae bacterium]|nr:PD-(D/E)XK nuclease-like domain-containing protein [Lachnospiraceae bacterium]